MNCELTYEQILSFFDFLKERNKPKSIEISTGDTNNENFVFKDCCYVKSMSISASENSLVSADYEFYVNSKNELDGSNKLFNNPLISDVPKLQSETKNDWVFDMQDSNKTPVGYWETSIEGFDKHVLDWKINISHV